MYYNAMCIIAFYSVGALVYWVDYMHITISSGKLLYTVVLFEDYVKSVPQSIV